MGNCWRKILQCFCLFQQAETHEKKPLLGKDEEDEGSSVDPPNLGQRIRGQTEYGSTVDVLDTEDTTPLLASNIVDDPICIDHMPDNVESSTETFVPEPADINGDLPNFILITETAQAIEDNKSTDIQSAKNGAIASAPDQLHDQSIPDVLTPKIEDQQVTFDFLALEQQNSPAEEKSCDLESTSLLNGNTPPVTSAPISMLAPKSLDSAGHSLSSGSSSLVTDHDEKFTLFGEEWDKVDLGRTKSARLKSPVRSPTFPKYRRLASEPVLLSEKNEDDERREDDVDSIAVTPTKRQLTAMELLQTETTYLRNLKIIIEIYKQPLEKAIADGEPILAPEDIRNIFGGVSDILKVHEQLHQDLSEVISNWREDCCIAEIITKYQGQLTDVYPNYVNYFDMGKDIIEKQKKAIPKFQEFLTNCLNNPTCLKQPLDALLIRPVQRLPSMSLLISDLQRRTPEEIPDHAELEKAKDSLKQVLSHINEDKRKTEGKMKVFDIIYEVEHCPVDIVSSNRLFVSRVNVTSLNSGLYRTGDRLALYLLTDMIEVSKFKRSSGNFLLKHVRMIPLSDIKLVIDIKDCEESDNMFAIQLVDKPSEKSNIQENAYHNENMDKLCVCQVLDDQLYKDEFLKRLREQMVETRDKISDEEVLKKMDSSQVQPMLKRGGSRVFRKGRGKPKRD